MQLKEVEEQVLMKEGEIRLLRDSLRGVQQEKDVQKEQRLLMEQQKHKEQQEKEKELLKKVRNKLHPAAPPHFTFTTQNLDVTPMSVILHLNLFCDGLGSDPECVL